MKYWLFKSEPDDFSFDDLIRTQEQGEIWDGIRNYQARNFLRDEVSVGDGVLFYHSSCKVPAVIGIAEVIETQISDPSAFDRNSKYFDEKSTEDNPRWITVKIKANKALKQEITLKQMKADTHLAEMHLVDKGGRLSIQPVRKNEWDYILKIGS